MDDLKVSHEYWWVNGIRMHVAVAGQGEPIVLLHGFPESWYSWRRVMPELSRSFRVIAPDLRGYGETEISRGGYDINTLAADVAELLSRAGEGRPVLLVGHDWGGVIGWHAASAYLGLIKGYAAVAAPHPARYLELLRKSPRQFIMSLYAFFFQTPLLPEFLLSMGGGAVPGWIMRASMKRPGGISPEELEVYRRGWSSRESMSAGLNYYRELGKRMFSSGSFYGGHRVSCPALVVWGDSDRFLSTAQTQGLERFVEGGIEVRILENCGHWIAQEAPDELLRAIMEFHERIAHGSGE